MALIFDCRLCPYSDAATGGTKGYRAAELTHQRGANRWRFGRVLAVAARLGPSPPMVMELLFPNLLDASGGG